MSNSRTPMQQAFDCLPRLDTASEARQRRMQIIRDAAALYRSRGGSVVPDQRTILPFIREAMDNHIANTERVEEDRLDHLHRHGENFRAKLRDEVERRRMNAKDQARPRPLEQDCALKMEQERQPRTPDKQPHTTVASAVTGNYFAETATLTKASRVPNISSSLHNGGNSDGEEDENFLITRHPIETGYIGVNDDDYEGKTYSFIDQRTKLTPAS